VYGIARQEPQRHRGVALGVATLSQVRLARQLTIMMSGNSSCLTRK
jgi:hypothetical protein